MTDIVLGCLELVAILVVTVTMANGSLNCCRFLNYNPYNTRFYRQLNMVQSIMGTKRDPQYHYHSFISNPSGWHLAPAFDMNPSFRKAEHVLSLDLYNRQPDFQVAVATAGYYRLDSSRAELIVREVCDVVKKWKFLAKGLWLSGQECSEAKHVFLVKASV